MAGGSSSGVVKQENEEANKIECVTPKSSEIKKSNTHIQKDQSADRLTMFLSNNSTLLSIFVFSLLFLFYFASANDQPFFSPDNMAAKYTLPDLPYGYDALEPIISAQIMQLHHSKHHQGYVNNLNLAEEKLAQAQAKNDVTAQIALQPSLKFNGGGHINHSIFWTNLCPVKDFAPPAGELLVAIQKDFGSLDAMVTKFNAVSAAVQGSGWGWLGYNKEAKRLEVTSTSNQDPLEPTTGLVPLLGIDVWEHAYYLDYKNARPEYLKAVWKIVNWKNVAQRFDQARA